MDLPSDMAIFKTFNVVDLHEYQPTKQLYPDYNSKTGSFEERRTDEGDQGNKSGQSMSTAVIGVLQSVNSNRLSCRQLPTIDIS